jgi:hypothetical protein
MLSMKNRFAAGAVVVAGLAMSVNADIFQREVGDQSREHAYSIDNTKDGGWVSAGYRFIDGRSFQYHIVKYKSDGLTEWERVFGGDREDIAYSVQQTSDGGYIVAGESRSFAPGFEIVLLRLDPLGNQVWARAYRGTYQTDVIHTPQPGVALDQSPDDSIFVVGNNEGLPVLFRVGPGGGLSWYAQYDTPFGPDDPFEVSFTDVEFSEFDRSVVVSGTYRRLNDDPTTGIPGRQDAMLFKAVPDFTAGGPPAGTPIFVFGYDSVFDRDSSDLPNVTETGDGLDVLPSGEIILAGRTDFGIDGGPFAGTFLVNTGPFGTPIWSRDYESFDADGNRVRVETAYAAVEWDPRFQAFVQAGRVHLSDAAGITTTLAHTQLTAMGGAPIWAWRYGRDEFRAGAESVQPQREDCGYALVGRVFNPSPFPGQGAGDIYLIKNNDDGETGCLEKRIFPEPVAPLEQRQITLRPKYFQENLTVPELTFAADGPNNPFCYDDDCTPGMGPCNPADLAAPFGALTFADISAFIASYTANTPPSDLAPPFGVWSFADVSAFLGFFTAGCP